MKYLVQPMIPPGRQWGAAAPHTPRVTKREELLYGKSLCIIIPQASEWRKSLLQGYTHRAKHATFQIYTVCRAAGAKILQIEVS